MSLINQMLRDLEERQAAPSAAFEASLQTPVVMAPPANSDRRRLKYTLSAGAAVVCLALLAWAGLSTGNPDPVATPPSPVGRASDSGQVTRPAPEPVATADSASAMEKPAVQTPAAPVGATEPPTSTQTRAPEKPEPQAPALPVTPQTLATATPDTTDAMASKPIATTRTHVASPAATQAPRRPSGPRHIEISERTLSVGQQAQRHYTGAVRALRAGDSGSSQQQLEQALELDPGHHQARLLLAGLHINQQRKQQAEILMAEGLALDPGHAPMAKLHAQLLIEQGRQQEAIQGLQSALPGAGQDADYHALLAGLYQHSGESLQAAEHYRTALRYDPGHGAWWMGLGLSLEQSGHSADAHAAYGQALKLPLSAALQHYVVTRMKRLSGDPQPGA